MKWNEICNQPRSCLGEMTLVMLLGGDNGISTAGE
jgi:hypothetical protein